LKEGKNPGTWKEMDNLSARQKIAHWFRHLRSKGTHVTATSKESDGRDDSVKPKRRMSEEEDDILESAPFLSISVSDDDEDGDATKRVTPTVDPLDQLFCEDTISVEDSIFGCHEVS